MTTRLTYGLRCVFLLAIVLVFTVTILSESNILSSRWFFPSLEEFQPVKSSNDINRCYKLPTDTSIDYFEDILDGEKQPISGKTIFFHETTCSKTGIVKLNAK